MNIAALLLLVPTILLGGEALAQGRLPCGDLDKIVLKLKAKYGELPTAIGLQNDGRLLQIYASPVTGTWTALAVAPNGTACVVASGEGWQHVAQDQAAGFTPIEYAGHPPAGTPDPYQGYNRADGTTSCCGGRDCAPVPYNPDLGLIFLFDNWIDPRTHVNPNRTEPAIYFSFDGDAHACVWGGQLVCAFIPGEGA